MIVTVTHTVMDGTVVRWYRDFAASETHRPFLSASRNGVMVHGEYLTDIADEVLALARETHKALRQGRGDVESLATHRRKGLFGPLEPIAPVSG